MILFFLNLINSSSEIGFNIHGSLECKTNLQLGNINSITKGSLSTVDFTNTSPGELQTQNISALSEISNSFFIILINTISSK